MGCMVLVQVPTSVVALAALVLVAAIGWAPTTIALAMHVDCANTSGIERGTARHAYDTIQDGLDAAVDGESVPVEPRTADQSAQGAGC